MDRPLRLVARGDPAQGRVRPARPRRRAERGRPAAGGRARARQGRQRPQADQARARDARRSRGARGGQARRRARPGAGRRDRPLPRPRRRGRDAAPSRYVVDVDSAAVALRLLVRAVPALLGRLPRHGRGRPADRRARLRRPLPHADPPDRRHQPQGRQQRADRAVPTTPARRRRSATKGVGGHEAVHPELGTLEDFDAPRQDRQRARPGDRDGLRDPVLGRPPVADRAPGVVPPPARRLAEVRREPAQEVPGHLQRQLPVRGLEEPLERAARRRAAVGRARGEGLPRRQPAHQAAGVLGVDDPRGPGQAPRHGLPGRGVHPPRGHAHAGQGRGSTSPTPTSPGSSRAGSWSSTSTSWPTSRPTTSAPTSSPTRRTSSPSSSSTAAARRSSRASCSPRR